MKYAVNATVEYRMTFACRIYHRVTHYPTAAAMLANSREECYVKQDRIAIIVEMLYWLNLGGIYRVHI